MSKSQTFEQMNGDTEFHTYAIQGSQDSFLNAYQKDTGAVHLVQNRQGELPIHTAILNRQTDMVVFLLSTIPAYQSALASRGRSVLHYAACYGSAEMVRRCCTIVPQYINAMDEMGETPLMSAITASALFVRSSADLEILQALIDHDADVSLLNSNGRTILHQAIATMKKPIIEWALDHIPPEMVQQPDRYGQTALSYLKRLYRTHPDFDEIEHLLLDQPRDQPSPAH